MTYPFLLESVWHPPLLFAEAADPNPPPEKQLQALWFAGAFGRDFRSTTGKAVRIVQFGEWNRGAGPDFVRAAVEIGGCPHHGAIELDLRSSFWESHGHAANPAFREVVLHVAFATDPAPVFLRNSDNREVPQIIINSSQLAEALHLPQRQVAIAHPGRCLAPLKQLPPSSLERLLHEAASHRAARKAARLLRAADAHGRDAALYQATAETLGYHANPLAMRLLAQRASLPLLRAEGAAAEAVLFGTAGFLAPDLHEQAPEPTRDYLRFLWESWWKSRARFEPSPHHALPWTLHGQRPANHPHRRIGALAALTASWNTFRSLAFADPFRTKPLTDFLHALEHPFWSHHHTLTSTRSATRIAPFGRSQAIELVANHLFPLALLEGRAEFRSYLKLRNSPPNDKVRRCSIRLFGSARDAAPWTRRVAHQQALLQIYNDFCLEDTSDCSRCPFPEQLLQWR